MSSVSVYKALVCERAYDGKYRLAVHLLAGERQDDGIEVNGVLVADDAGWHESEWGAVTALADQIEMIGEELVDRAGRMREAL